MRSVGGPGGEVAVAGGVSVERCHRALAAAQNPAALWSSPAPARRRCPEATAQSASIRQADHWLIPWRAAKPDRSRRWVHRHRVPLLRPGCLTKRRAKFRVSCPQAVKRCRGCAFIRNRRRQIREAAAIVIFPKGLLAFCCRDKDAAAIVSRKDVGTIRAFRVNHEPALERLIVCPVGVRRSGWQRQRGGRRFCRLIDSDKR